MRVESAKYKEFMRTRDPLTFTLVCRICHQTKPLVEYYRQEASKNCHRSECKLCTNKVYNTFDANGYKRKLYTNKKSHAKATGTEFTISVESIVWVDICPVIGTKLVYAVGGRDRSSKTIPSLDRVDSSLGYIPGNVQVISAFANTMKNNITLAEARNLVAYMEGSPCPTTELPRVPRVKRKTGFKPRRAEVMPPHGYIQPDITKETWTLHQ